LAKTGETFVGWNTAPDGSGTSYSVGASYTTNADVTLFAEWTALPTYTITYNANGADSGSVPSDQTKIQGIDLTLASNTESLSRTGYTFVGWNTLANGSGTSYSEGASYTADADLTFYANWTALPTYTISYNANGADSGSVPSNQTKIQGNDISLASNTGELSLYGFEFAGWNTKSDGSGETYSPGAMYSIDESIALYAKWIALPTYNISYDIQASATIYGTWPYVIRPTPSEHIGVVQGDYITIQNIGFSRTGWDFWGWNTLPDGSGIDLVPGESIQILDNSTSVLYANGR
jgi:uncharacterized repeat protein (TIGR02543 family)